MKHELKVVKSLYARIADGSKNFLIKDSGRDFQKGDHVLIKEWDDDFINPTSTTQRGFTGRELDFQIGFVELLGGSQVCFSLLPNKKSR